MPPPPIPPRRTTRSTSGTRDQNCLNLSFSTLTFRTVFFNMCNSSGFRRKTYDSWDEATASTSKDEHPPKLRRSTRVAAAEAKEKMSFTEEISSKFSQIKMDYSLPPSLTPNPNCWTLLNKIWMFCSVCYYGLCMCTSKVWKGRMGWIWKTTPTADDVYAAIEKMDPSHKEVIEVSFFPTPLSLIYFNKKHGIQKNIWFSKNQELHCLGSQGERKNLTRPSWGHDCRRLWSKFNPKCQKHDDP